MPKLWSGHVGQLTLIRFAVQDVSGVGPVYFLLSLANDGFSSSITSNLTLYTCLLRFPGCTTTRPEVSSYIYHADRPSVFGVKLCHLGRHDRSWEQDLEQSSMMLAEEMALYHYTELIVGPWLCLIHDNLAAHPIEVRNLSRSDHHGLLKLAFKYLNCAPITCVRCINFFLMQNIAATSLNPSVTRLTSSGCVRECCSL